MNSYTLRPLAEMPKDLKVENGLRLCRMVLRDVPENKGKKSQYCILPEVTENFVQTFIGTDKGMEAVKDYIETLQNAAVRKVYVRLDRSPCAADLSIDALVEIAEESSESARLTKEVLVRLFEAEWKNRIAFSLVYERDPGAVVQLESDAESFWNSESGCKYLQIASNYKQFIMYGAERKPGFASQLIKDKVLAVLGYLDTSIIVDKLVEKLKDAPVVSVDTLAL